MYKKPELKQVTSLSNIVVVAARSGMGNCKVTYVEK